MQPLEWKRQSKCDAYVNQLTARYSWPKAVHSDMMCLWLLLDTALGQVENISTHTWDDKSLLWEYYVTLTASFS